MASATAEHSINGQMSIDAGRVGQFLKTLPTQVKVVVKETSVRAVVDSVVYQQADVLITELDGEDETPAKGREALLALCTQLPELRVIAYTRCRNAEELGRLLPQPNVSIVARDDALPLVAEFFNRVLLGERVLSPQIGTFLAPSVSADEVFTRKLTRCETDVLAFLFNGMSLRQIAELQRRSIKTISAHKCSAMRKLQVKNDSELFSLHGNITRQFGGKWSKGT